MIGPKLMYESRSTSPELRECNSTDHSGANLNLLKIESLNINILSDFTPIEVGPPQGCLIKNVINTILQVGVSIEPIEIGTRPGLSLKI